MDSTIYLVFVDDWELSGDGSGDPRTLQFQPMRELVSIYNRHGISGSFNAEIMQQLAFREWGQNNPQLKAWADEWDQIVCETFKQGHDVQLHIHPQWSEARFEDGRWELNGDWSILNYPADEAWRMIAAGKQYLENLLQPINPDYRCVSFRSGSWCIAPSPHILTLLAEAGIVFDMSIVGGVRYHTRRIDLDYRNCEEDFLPYYPHMTDARKVSERAEPIVCIPTNHFYGSRRSTLQHHKRKAMAAVKSRTGKKEGAASGARTVQSYGHEWAQADASLVDRLYTKGIQPYLKGRHLISDLAQMDYQLMREMLASIRRRARDAGAGDVPVILENHTKDIQDFSHIESFVAEVAAAPDIKCMTLTGIAAGIQRGQFRIKTKTK
jgi:hypothetical protein